MIAFDLSYFANFEQDKIVNSHFADFEQLLQVYEFFGYLPFYTI